MHSNLRYKNAEWVLNTLHPRLVQVKRTAENSPVTVEQLGRILTHLGSKRITSHSAHLIFDALWNFDGYVVDSLITEFDLARPHAKVAA